MSSTVDSYARALVDIAAAEGNLSRVEDELYRVARVFETNDQLRSTLTDETMPIERRQGVVEQLLGGKASNTTTQLVSFIIGNGRGREMRLSKRQANKSISKLLLIPQFSVALLPPLATQ